MSYKLKSDALANAMKWTKQRRILAREQGDCLYCFKFSAEPDRLHCVLCGQKRRERDRVRRGSKPRVFKRDRILTTVKDDLGELNVNHYQSHRSHMAYCAVDRAE